MRKKILAAFILATAMLVGCGSTQQQNAGTPVQDTTVVTGDSTSATSETISDCATDFPFGEEFYSGRWYMEELVEPKSLRTAAEIYDSMTYTEQMFFGEYRLNHKGDSLPKHYATKAFVDNVTYQNASAVSDLLDGNLMISSLPYKFVAGVSEIDNALISDTTHSWCILSFATQNSDSSGVSVEAAYTVEGDTITFQPLAEWGTDADSQLYYTFQDKTFSYKFSFAGPRLTFSNDTCSYTFIERDFTNDMDVGVDHSIVMTSSLSQNSPMINRIIGIDFTVYVDANYKLNVNKSAFELNTIDNDGNEIRCYGIARWDEDGLFTFSFQDAKGATRSRQLVMFYCGFDGVVFSDGSKNYYYLSTFLSEATAGYYSPEQLEEIVDGLGANLSEEDQELLETMTEEEIEEIIETRTDLLADLAAAFSEKGIKADIDETTGEIVLDSSILFAKGESSLSGEGEAALTDFITAFAGVISNDKYDGFISKVEVQGHTDTDGDYDMNLELSQQRAESVRDYCLNDVPSLSKNTLDKLNELLVPVGYSYDFPKYNEDGTVDMNASRRVEFIFFINLAGR